MSDEDKRKGNYQSSSDKYSRFTASISKEVYKILNERAKAEKRNKSFFVEEALKYYFSHPPGVQEPGVSYHPDESAGLQESISLLSERIASYQEENQSLKESLSKLTDSMEQVSELVNQNQMQIDAIKQQVESTPQVISKPPASKEKKNEIEISPIPSNIIDKSQITDTTDIESDMHFSLIDAVSILKEFSKKVKPLSTDALRMRCNRALQDKNYGVGIKTSEGYFVKGSFLLSYLKPEIVQQPL